MSTSKIHTSEESPCTMPADDVKLIYQKLEHLTALLEERAKADAAARAADRARIRRLELRLEGTDDEPEKGVVVRLDRVEQWKARAQKMMWILAGSAVTFFAERLLNLLS